MKIKSIDLWTEQYCNHYECFNGAFVDGFDCTKIPFDEYKIVKNCNCIITVSQNDIHISNKHQAIVFYKNKIPVRLMVINKNTDVNKCVEVSLNQYFKDSILKDYYTLYGNFASDKYEFIPNLFIKYELVTDKEEFEIEHKCAFINTIRTRLIPIQENSSLTKN